MEPSASTTPNFVPLPAPPELNYISAENAIAAMMSFAKEHGYGMSLKRSKPDGKDVVKTRYYYHCDRHGNYSPRGLIRERTSRSTGCMFQILIQKIHDSQLWTLKVKNPTHNHGPMVPEKEKASAKKKIKVWKVALIPGDGIGVEVTEAAVTTLQRLATSTKRFELQFESFNWGTEQYRQQGFYMPPDWENRLKRFDAIFLGAIGSPDVPDHVSLWSLKLPLRSKLKQYVNVRPSRILRGITSPLRNVTPKDLDWVIIRENSEGEYSGHGGITHPDLPFGVATDVSIFTRQAIERVFQFAFEVAKSRPRKKLTMVTKSNAQRWGMVYWDQIFQQIKSRPEYADVETEVVMVDTMTVRMVFEPHSFDTIVATNLHADILSDLAAALSGSLGIAPSSNLDPTKQNPSMFEPIHGSRPELAGKNMANPLGALWSAAEMIKWLGDEKAGDLMIRCIENVTEWGVRTRDLSGSNTTTEVTAAVCQEIERMSRLEI